MGADRSLDEFAPDETDVEDDTTEADISPTTPTYRWSADDEPCPQCGTPVTKLWADSGEFVCGECKEW